jgi:FkbM family methyltransferase
MFRSRIPPAPIILDRLGVLKSEYRVKIRSDLNLELRPSTSDRYAFYEVFMVGQYSRFPSLFRPGGTVIDVGANVGCFSLYAASQVGKGGLVVAAEPVPHIFRQLQKNARLNEQYRIVPVNAAIRAQSGTTELYLGKKDLFSSHFSVHGTDQISAEKIQVRAMTLEALLDEAGIERVDVLKLDCEGAEYEILESLPSHILERIGAIVAEIHTIPGHSPRELVAILEKSGFQHRKRHCDYFFRASESLSAPPEN